MLMTEKDTYVRINTLLSSISNHNRFRSEIHKVGLFVCHFQLSSGLINFDCKLSPLNLRAYLTVLHDLYADRLGFGEENPF